MDTRIQKYFVEFSEKEVHHDIATAAINFISYSLTM